MTGMSTRRGFSSAICAAPALLLGSRKAAAQIPAPEWGQLWQPVLPKSERHPFLYYDETTRNLMKARTLRAPWKTWWEELQRGSGRSSPAVRWWLTGDEESAKHARTDLLEVPIFRNRRGYLYPSSHHLTDYVAAYDLLASWRGVTTDDHRAIRNRIAAEADHHYRVLSGGAIGGANYGNQRTLAASALGTAALAICGYSDSPNGPAAWLSRALYEIRREENFRFFRPGGQFVEGEGYTNYMNVGLLPFSIAYERATGKFLLAEPRLRDSLVFASYQILAGGDVIPWGTSELWRGIPIFALLSNRRYGRQLAPLFSYVFGRTLQPHPLHRHIALAHYEDTVPGAMPPGTRVFPGSHFAVFRDDWGHDCVSVWFGGKEAGWWSPGIYGYYSHGDCGSFVVAMADEILAADSGYDHWKSRDYYGAEFHNVLLVDGQGPDSFTTGEMTQIDTAGPVRRATVTASYQGCTVKRTLAQVRGRYVVVLDRVTANSEHDYCWQVRSTCPYEAEGTRITGRDVTWPGLSKDGWRDLVPGRTQLTTVVPPFAGINLGRSRWRPSSALPEFNNQVALAKWRAAGTEALFVLIPNLREKPDVKWKPGAGQDVIIEGPGFTDTVGVKDGELRIAVGRG